MTEQPPPLGLGPYEPTPQQIAHEGALDHVLAAISRSPWGDHLVLRGSVLMRAWYGVQARVPHDLDFVVDSDVWCDDETQTHEIFDELFAAVGALPRTALVNDLWFVPSRVERTFIDAYDPCETLVRERQDGHWGYRLTLPWRCGGLSGDIQVDFSFDEKLPGPPVATAVPRPAGEAPLRVRAATPAQSLCWKLMWLWRSSALKGKDLYDAWLLRHTRFPMRLLDDMCDVDGMAGPLGRDWLAADSIDWPEFQRENPMVRGSAADYVAALRDDLLRPVFGARAAARPGNRRR